MTIKKGDFVEVNYTGRLKESGTVFDTTLEATAKEAGIHDTKVVYQPFIVKIGEGQLLKGLDTKIEGKPLGKHTLSLTAEEGFGRKDAGLLKLMPLKVFKDQKIEPFPGLDVEVDGQRGIIRTVSGGRIIVDFNHPLSGKDLEYDVELIRVVTDLKEKAEAYISLTRLPIEVKGVEGDKLVLLYKTKLPDELKKKFEEDVKKVVGAKEIVAEEEKQATSKEKKKD